MPSFSYDNTSAEDELIRRVEDQAHYATPASQKIGADPEQVYEYLVRAMRHISNLAPRRLATRLSTDGSGQSPTNESETTVIPLPEDWIRVLRLRLSSWDRPIRSLEPPTSSVVMNQYRPETRADALNPVATADARSSAPSGVALYCWPAGSGPTIDALDYVAETAPEDVIATLQPPIVTQAASYLLSAKREEGWELSERITEELLTQIQSGEEPNLGRAQAAAEE